MGRILGKGSIGYVPGVDGQACTKLERVSKEARESCKDFDMFTLTSVLVADQADIGATCIMHSCILSQDQVQTTVKARAKQNYVA